MNKISKQMYVFSLFLFSFSFVLATGEILPPVSSLSGASSSLAQNGVSKTLPLIDAEQVLKSNYVTYIKFSFCDDKAIDKGFALDAGKEKDVCVQFQNALNMDVQLWTEIVDGYTIEPWGIRGCLDNPNGNKQFIPGVIVPSRGNTPLSIPAGKTVRQTLKIKFPSGSNGVKHACMTYGVMEATSDLGANFSMRFRRESYMDFVVKGVDGMKSKIDILPFDDGKTIKSYLDIDDKLVMEFKLQNTGSVDEMITISGFVHNMFGFVQPFVISGIRLNVGVTKTIRSTDYGIVFDMPFYKGLFDIQWTVQHKPFFEFDVSAFGIDPKLLAGGIKNEVSNAFFFPWLMLAALLALILFIKMAFFKKAKIVYVQVPQQPVQTPPTNV